MTSSLSPSSSPRSPSPSPWDGGRYAAGTEPRPLPDVVPYDRGRRAELAARERAGALRRVRRGVYVPASGGGDLDREAAILTEVRGVVENLTTSYWISHVTAALLWGCWTWRTPLHVHLTQLGNPRVERQRDPVLRRHWTALPARDRQLLDGVPVTSLERTLVDCARSLPVPGGLVVADSALRVGANPRTVDQILTESKGKRGVVRARRVLELADVRSGSPGETLIRLAAVEAGCPPFEPQFPVETARGTSWLDLGWPDLRIGIEFDGALKYSGGEYGDPEQVRREEHARQAALEGAGWIIVRVTWEELADPEALGRKLWAARLERRRRRR